MRRPTSCWSAFRVSRRSLGVEEFELFAAAGLLRPELDAPLTIASAARQVRQASRLLSRVLTEAAVPSSGEAIIADRILHHKLDYQVAIWPVVRGHSGPLHLHSLIALKPLEPDHSKQRKKTADIERLPLHERRHHIRHNVISDGIWRSFGMAWREENAQWNLGSVPLTIELPIEERNRAVPDEVVFPELQVSRILVLAPPWGHAELMAALLADALRFGSIDLRYQGFVTERQRDEKQRFCVDRLREATEQTVWAIAEAPRLMSALTPDLLNTGAARSSSCSPTVLGCALRPLASSTSGCAGSTRPRPDSGTSRSNSTGDTPSSAHTSTTRTCVPRQVSRGRAWSTATSSPTACGTSRRRSSTCCTTTAAVPLPRSGATGS